MKKNKIFLFLAVSMLLAVVSFSPIALAAEFRVPERKGGSVAVNEELKNLYTFGNIISVNGDIEKNLHIGGAVVTVNGDVGDTLSIAGGTITTKGDVLGSGFLAGGNVLIEGSVSDDLFVAGGNVFLSDTAEIGEDVLAAGGMIEINSPINGDLKAMAGSVFINSEIKGDVVIKSKDEIRLGSLAKIHGDFKYWSYDELVMDEGAEILGEINFEKKIRMDIANISSAFKYFLKIAILIKLLSGIIVGLALIYLLKKFVGKVVRDGLESFWHNLGSGFGVLILLPIACIILAITIIGIWLSCLIFSGFTLLLILSSSLASIMFGSWIIKLVTKKSEYSIDWRAVVVGTILLGLISWIPFVGMLIKLIFVLLSMGAIYRMFYRNIFPIKNK